MIKNYKIIDEPQILEFFAWYKVNANEHLRQDIKSRSHRIISRVDFEELKKAFGESKFLPKIRSFKWLMLHYFEIINGRYADFPTKVLGSREMAKLTELERQALGERNIKEKHYRNYLEAYENSSEFKEVEDRLPALEMEMAQAEYSNNQAELKRLEEEKARLIEKRKQSLVPLGLTEESCGLKNSVDEQRYKSEGVAI